MFKRQRDANCTHQFLWQRLLTTRPPECVNHDILTIIFFTICRMWVVILRLFCGRVMQRGCWCNLEHLLSSKTKFISTKKWHIIKRTAVRSFFTTSTRPQTFKKIMEQTNTFQDHQHGFFKFHKLKGRLIKKYMKITLITMKFYSIYSSIYKHIPVALTCDI